MWTTGPFLAIPLPPRLQGNGISGCFLQHTHTSKLISISTKLLRIKDFLLVIESV